jgi:hypothetical protein
LTKTLVNRVVENYFNFMANMLLSIKPNERVHGHTFFYNTENHDENLDKKAREINKKNGIPESFLIDKKRN